MGVCKEPWFFRTGCSTDCFLKTLVPQEFPKSLKNSLYLSSLLLILGLLAGCAADTQRAARTPLGTDTLTTSPAGRKDKPNLSGYWVLNEKLSDNPSDSEHHRPLGSMQQLSNDGRNSAVLLVFYARESSPG
ncbi:hypothetical protein CCP4SC76_3110005 [Gammaproteobacteria bacterium]